MEVVSVVKVCLIKAMFCIQGNTGFASLEGAGIIKGLAVVSSVRLLSDILEGHKGGVRGGVGGEGVSKEFAIG